MSELRKSLWHAFENQNRFTTPARRKLVGEIEEAIWEMEQQLKAAEPLIQTQRQQLYQIGITAKKRERELLQKIEELEMQIQKENQ